MSDTAGNVWNAGTLEWLPNDIYGPRSIPLVTSREPLWDQPDLSSDVEAGRYYLPGTATGRRETIVTSPIEATPQYLLRLPGPGWTPFLAAVFTAAFFLLLTVKLVTLALALRRARDRRDPGLDVGERSEAARPRVEIGGGIKLPTYATGPLSHSWWAMVVLLLVAGSLYLAYVFSYLYLWTVSPQVWPRPEQLPPIAWPLMSGALLAASSGFIFLASRVLPVGSRNNAAFVAADRARPSSHSPAASAWKSSRTGARGFGPTPTRTPPWSTWRRSFSFSWCWRSS